MAGTVVITRRQLHSIQEAAQRQEQAGKQARHAELRETSVKRAATWPNTLQAQRERRARALQVQLAAEEAARVEADKADAVLRAEEHRAQLATAAAALWQQSDRVKALAGRALLGDVLAERDCQVAAAAGAAGLARQADAAFVAAQRRRLESAAAEEWRKLEAAQQRAALQRDQQLAQLEVLQRQILADREQNWQEGQRLQEQAAADTAAQRLKSMAAAAERADADAASAERKRRADWAAVDGSRKAQLATKQAQREAACASERQAAASLAQQAAAQHAAEEDAARLAALAADTREFQAHAAAAIAERVGEQKPVGPMRLYLQSLPAQERKLLPARRAL
ncbi:hypothetical protein WJX81_000072 [Elliptochloris bilobata]|uniref:Trichohyalin-plectin-homology domain-containing protein n=1 Tax=Elliptochloris bilobata TaxID=381761 RepID=A0AAW1SJ01_9CHLO